MSYPSSLSPAKPGQLNLLSPARSAKSRARREPSGVFSLFQTSQIQQFKEAFSLIDQDGDGIVTEADLKGIFGSLGERASSYIYCTTFEHDGLNRHKPV